MNIENSDLSFIRRALLNNTAVLFTGAGFSCDAQNSSGCAIPLGGALADKLWEYLGYSGKRTGESLQRLFEAALAKGHGPLKGFLKENFECKTYASWYRLISSFYWYRIYTTNIDNVLEKAYHDAGGVRLQRIDGQRGDFVERDAFLTSVQYVKLNGQDWESPADITFSFRQYARRAGETPVWYEQLARDFATRVIIFVGTELDEQLFWNAIELRGKKFGDGEKRPKSFWIKPNFSPVDLDNLKAFNVIGIPGTAKEFFEILLANTKEERELNEVIRSAHPNFHKLAQSLAGAINNRQLRDLEEFYTAYTPVFIPDRIPATRKSFLLGAAPDWPAIHNNLDAPRTCSSDLHRIIEGEFAQGHMAVVAVSGSAGCGKSTILRRLALDLRSKGYLVFWSRGETYVAPHVFADAVSVLPSRPVFFLDNVSQVRGVLVRYLSICTDKKLAPLFVISDRTNKLYHFQNSLAEDYRVIPFAVPNLSQQDIESLLDTLGSNGLLGRLQGLARRSQIFEFSIRAGKQLLVAMREATSGIEFDQIIGNEFSSLSSDEIRIVYLCVCIATSAGYPVTAQQLVAFSDLEPNQALGLLDGELRDVVVSMGSVRGGLVARHRIIASLVVDQLAPRELLQQAYVRLLAVISKDFAYPLRASSRGFRLYRAVINHEAVWSRFPHSLSQARSIYESVRGHFQNDSHFWLQYGSLEVEFGELELAEVYVSSAESLAPNDELVQNTKGFLCYKRAVATDRLLEAIRFREEARRILELQCARSPDNGYPYHILHSMELAYIKQWITERSERTRHMEKLRRDIEVCVKRNRYSDRLATLRKTINDAYLEMALE